MQEHVLDDGIGALPVLNDLVEIAAQHVRELVDFRTEVIVEGSAVERLAQLVDQLAGKGGEIVDEIERVLDLMRDARRQLAEGGELFGLHKAVLRRSELFQRAGELSRASLNLLKKARILDCDH